jgi:hypothetical protein
MISHLEEASSVSEISTVSIHRNVGEHLEQYFLSHSVKQNTDKLK